VHKQISEADHSIENKVDTAIEVTVYVDPLCCWSWAFESHLESLKNKLGTDVHWKYRMCGLIPSWKNFYDEVNNVARPAQMGPVWMHAGQIMNKPINYQIWIKDPPASSFPACIAVKSAQLQGEVYGQALLKTLWQKCMVEGQNISKQSVLNEIMKFFVTGYPAFDLQKYKNDYTNGNAENAFREDLELVQYYRLNRFPSVIIKVPDRQTVLVKGYRNYDDLVKIFEAVVTSPQHTTLNH
jgi:putative protein-disulfide isomerase